MNWQKQYLKRQLEKENETKRNEITQIGEVFTVS